MIVKQVFDLLDAVEHLFSKLLFKVRVHVTSVHHQSSNLEERRPYVMRYAQHVLTCDDDDVRFHFSPMIEKRSSYTRTPCVEGVF